VIIIFSAILIEAWGWVKDSRRKHGRDKVLHCCSAPPKGPWLLYTFSTFAFASLLFSIFYMYCFPHCACGWDILVSLFNTVLFTQLDLSYSPTFSTLLKSVNWEKEQEVHMAKVVKYTVFVFFSFFLIHCATCLKLDSIQIHWVKYFTKCFVQILCKW